ncbi:hypothetical protein CHCC20375_1607 [Bacillus licheniformis]|nr:hypothetical protein CHCC20375_1607 [Bacillus licheniformis]
MIQKNNPFITALSLKKAYHKGIVQKIANRSRSLYTTVQDVTFIMISFLALIQTSLFPG